MAEITVDVDAMADAINEINATYEELTDLERDFEDVETEISKCNFLWQIGVNCHCTFTWPSGIFILTPS